MITLEIHLYLFSEYMILVNYNFIMIIKLLYQILFKQKHIDCDGKLDQNEIEKVLDALFDLKGVPNSDRIGIIYTYNSYIFYKNVNIYKKVCIQPKCLLEILF